MRNSIITLLALALLGCGGGGVGIILPPGNQQPVLLAAQRYFPSPVGAVYSYRVTSVDENVGLSAFDGEEMTYDVQANPLGAGVYYNLQDNADAVIGPAFNGLRFIGCLKEVGGTTSGDTTVSTGNQPEVLPAVLTGLGQQWQSNFTTLRTNSKHFLLSGTSRLAAVEDVTIGATTLQDCLRVDVQFNYGMDRDGDGVNDLELPTAMTGSYWLAPDVGVVQGVLRIAGVTVCEVRLVSASIP
jgi:hypothetical protein